MKSAYTVQGGEDVVIPPGSEKTDYEVELGSPPGPTSTRVRSSSR
ncbi:hypothetical protein [Paraoerskovia sediminicola]|nr:hypothetical protein [Paraoerskovia sediminicola]